MAKVDFRLWDAGEHARLLASRARAVARQWRSVRRAVDGEVAAHWPEPARALIELAPASSLDAPLVALADELEELVELQAAWDCGAIDELVDHFASSEHLMTLMPRGRLPRDPRPAVRRILDGIQRDLTARLVVQVAIDQPDPPPSRGSLRVEPRLAPSWGHAPGRLLLGRARAVVEGAIPRRLRFDFDLDGFALVGAGLRLAGAWGGEWAIRAPSLRVELVPRVGPWPLLPTVVDEDGRSARGRRRRLRDRAELIARIERARAVLAEAWPAGARCVDDFTRAVIPVAQSQIVSYSFAPVPGWSYINLYDRDFVDLVDDLVHENAHHHLNHILADAPLLTDAGTEEDLIYYSPWREALRPLRGILHSVFTFAAGAELFRHLADLPRPFSTGERAKIAARCLEETAQVRYSLEDLAHAARRGRLTGRGRAMVDAIARDMRGFDAIAPSLRRKIAGTRWRTRIAALERSLRARARGRARARFW